MVPSPPAAACSKGSCSDPKCFNNPSFKFGARVPFAFQPGMKIEVVDGSGSFKICVMANKKEGDGEIKLHTTLSIDEKDIMKVFEEVMNSDVLMYTCGCDKCWRHDSRAAQIFKGHQFIQWLNVELATAATLVSLYEGAVQDLENQTKEDDFGMCSTIGTKLSPKLRGKMLVAYYCSKKTLKYFVKPFPPNRKCQRRSGAECRDHRPKSPEDEKKEQEEGDVRTARGVDDVTEERSVRSVTQSENSRPKLKARRRLKKVPLKPSFKTVESIEDKKRNDKNTSEALVEQTAQNETTNDGAEEPAPEIVVPKPDPIPCSICHKNIQPKDEIFYKVTCTAEQQCTNTVHKECFQSIMKEQGLKKKREYRNAKCFNTKCGRPVLAIFQTDIEGRQSLYLNCADSIKKQPEGVRSKTKKEVVAKTKLPEELDGRDSVVEATTVTEKSLPTVEEAQPAVNIIQPKPPPTLGPFYQRTIEALRSPKNFKSLLSPGLKAFLNRHGPSKQVAPTAKGKECDVPKPTGTAVSAEAPAVAKQEVQPKGAVTRKAEEGLPSVDKATLPKESSSTSAKETITTSSAEVSKNTEDPKFNKSSTPKKTLSCIVIERAASPNKATLHHSAIVADQKPAAEKPSVNPKQTANRTLTTKVTVGREATVECESWDQLAEPDTSAVPSSNKTTVDADSGNTEIDITGMKIVEKSSKPKNGKGTVPKEITVTKETTVYKEVTEPEKLPDSSVVDAKHADTADRKEPEASKSATHKENSVKQDKPDAATRSSSEKSDEPKPKKLDPKIVKFDSASLKALAPAKTDATKAPPKIPKTTPTAAFSIPVDCLRKVPKLQKSTAAVSPTKPGTKSVKPAKSSKKAAITSASDVWKASVRSLADQVTQNVPMPAAPQPLMALKLPPRNLKPEEPTRTMKPEEPPLPNYRILARPKTPLLPTPDTPPIGYEKRKRRPFAEVVKEGARAALPEGDLISTDDSSCSGLISMAQHEDILRKHLDTIAKLNACVSEQSALLETEIATNADLRRRLLEADRELFVLRRYRILREHVDIRERDLRAGERRLQEERAQVEEQMRAMSAQNDLFLKWHTCPWQQQPQPATSPDDVPTTKECGDDDDGWSDANWADLAKKCRATLDDSAEELRDELAELTIDDFGQFE